jgi:predicted enzyme related to lactoylglutathione lyase
MADGVVLQANDLDGDFARLLDRGVVSDDEIAERPGGRSVGFADPDGNRFVLQATTIPS